MNKDRHSSTPDSPLAGPICHHDRVAEHLRRFSLIAACATLTAGIAGLIAGATHGCTIGWSNSGSSRTTAVLDVERTGPGQYRVHRNRRTAAERARSTNPSIDVPIEFGLDVSIPDWMDSRTFPYKLESFFSRSGPSGRTYWEIQIVLLTDPFARPWSQGGSPSEVSRDEADEFAAALCAELGITHVANPGSVPAMTSGTGGYPVRLAAWSSPHRCAISIPLTIFLGASFALVTLAVCRAAWLVRCENQRHRIGKGACAWCEHPIEDHLCTECGTDYHNMTRPTR